MKIYNEIVFDVDGNVIYEDSFEYSGDVMLLQPHDPDNPIHTSDDPNEVIDLNDPSFKDAEWWIDFYKNRELDAQTQASDIQLNPLPSLPSITNVGSIAPTGVINWNAIPGGFQPLPQVAGGGKKLYQLSQFHGGINQKSSPRDIAEFECQEATNVTFSEIGRIKLLGDCANLNNLSALPAMTHANLPGYGFFEFTAPADQEGNLGEEVIVLSGDGATVDARSESDTWAAEGEYNIGWINMSDVATDDDATAHIYHAASNGVYVTDANFGSGRTTRTKAKIYVYREDFNGLQTTRGWADNVLKGGNLLIDSPRHSTNANTAGTVFLDHDDAAAGANVAFPGSNLTSTYGATTVHTGSDGDISGTWNGSYFFYISWLFDNGCETGLSALQPNTGSAKSFSDETLYFNFSCKANWNAAEYIANTFTNCNHIGLDQNFTYLIGEPRIEGARIYFKKEGTAERWLLAEVSLVDGVRGALDFTYKPWTESSDVFYLDANILFENPPEVHSYLSKNAYSANEVYDESGDTLSNLTTGPKARPVKYKTVVVGQAGVVFIGNVMFDGRHIPDSMMFSMKNRPGVFPKLNRFDSPSSDGSPIIALAAFQDKILQFKKNSLYVINVSNPGQFYAESSFRECGVFNPCQVFTTAFGVIFVNKHGCFIYDGSKVISLTGGKFDWIKNSGIEEDVSNQSDAKVPSIGYDPRSQNIIILKDIGNDSTSYSSGKGDQSWVYNMITQSWTEGDVQLWNVADQRISNFIITSKGYLSYTNSASIAVLNFNHDMLVGTNSYASSPNIRYTTKDIDFGSPSQTKKIFKVYITYKGDADGLSVVYGVDGGTLNKGFNSDATPLSDTGSTLTVATLTPTTASEATDIKSFALQFEGYVGIDVSDTFEINDISILYRVRPIK